MGTLSPGFGGSAQGAANDSFLYSKAATGLDTVGALASGIGGYQLSSYQAAVASNNAKIAEANAQADLSSGQYEESAAKEKTGQVIGQERAAQGANNIDVNVGSAKAVQQSTAAVGAMDAAMIHYNAARAAYGERIQERSDTAESGLLKNAALGSLFGGVAKAGGTLLGGASSLAGRYAQWQLEAGNGSGT